jgi:hypothetical protein
MRTGTRQVGLDYGALDARGDVARGYLQKRITDNNDRRIAAQRVVKRQKGRAYGVTSGPQGKMKKADGA